ncbi:MAG: hypothetical protein WC554_13760 [Clostridia bacterium]
MSRKFHEYREKITRLNGEVVYLKRIEKSRMTERGESLTPLQFFQLKEHKKRLSADIKRTKAIYESSVVEPLRKIRFQKKEATQQTDNPIEQLENEKLLNWCAASLMKLKY